jgi:transposase
MRMIGVDLHTRQQSVAMLDTDTGEVIEKTLKHEGDEVREFYSALPGPVLVGIEATGCRVGHPAKVRAAEPRKQKHDRRDARLLLTLLAENRFPAIWMPSTEQRDLRTLLRHRHQSLAAARWVADRSPYLLETSLPGVFAVGDVRCGSVKRVASAVGEGSIAVSFVHRALAE